MSFSERVRERCESLGPEEGACGLCHGVLEGIVEEGGGVSAYEEPNGIRAVVRDDRGKVIGEGFDIVWSPAILSAEIEAGTMPFKFVEQLRREGVSSIEEIAKMAALYGYGRVLTPGVIALEYVQLNGGRTTIRREGLGVRAIMFDSEGNELSHSSISYCPTCAIAKAILGNEDIHQYVRQRLRGARNTGKLKYERRLENVYRVSKGGIKVSILEGDHVLAKDVAACCIAYGTTKAEIAAGLIIGESAKRFKAYCNLCPMKHCWMEKSMGAMGNIVLKRLTELGTEIEIRADGLIIAKVAGTDEVIEGRGTLCSLSALTNMLMRADGVKLLKPSKAVRFPDIKEQ
ncbi:MAG: hypothetical protein HPY73_00070 [Methanomassiliicoccales archaeon]|nr:MAG: hypothetical protein HPY73_00070 [Methanomassiliicoccales archaeon]